MDSDKKDLVKLVPMEETGMSHLPVPVERIKSVFICEGISAAEIAERFHLSEAQVQKVITDNKLVDLRSAYVRQGIAKLQNTQLNQAQKLMDLESKFKGMRIIQLEKVLEDHLAYHAKHGHFYKLHPVTQEILRDTNGLPLQIKIPNIIKEITDLKETVTLSEGLKVLLAKLDDIINKPKDAEKIDPNTIDMAQFGGLFQAKELRDEDEDD